MLSIKGFCRLYDDHRWSLIFLSVVTILMFLGTLMGEFVYDDLGVVLNNQEIKRLDFWGGWGWAGRHTRSISLMLDYKLFGHSPYGYHIQNILWHLLSVLLLYLLFFKLSNDRFVAFLGALFFAVHPIHAEPVANISNRKEQLCMSFSLLSFLSYINFIKGDRKKIWFILSLVSWYLALNSKEVAIVLPISFLAYEFVFLSEEEKCLLKRPVLLLVVIISGIIATLVYVFAAVDFNKISSIFTLGGYRGDVGYIQVAINSAKALWCYIKMLLLPFNLTPDYSLELSTSMADPGLIFLWFMGLILAISPFYIARKNLLVSFGIFWMLIHYIPVSNIIPLSYIVADRYMYIPSAGFCLLLASFCASICRVAGNKLVLVAVSLLCFTMFAGYSITTISYNNIWKNEATLWTHAVNVMPLSYKSHASLGNANYRRGNYSEAIKNYSMAIELNTRNYVKVYSNRAYAYLQIKKYKAAISDFEHVVKTGYGHRPVYYNLGLLYANVGDTDKSIHYYKKAARMGDKRARERLAALDVQEPLK